MAVNTPWGPGTRYPWDPDPNAPAAPAAGGVPGARPAVTPGGGVAAPGAGGAPITRPANVYLSPQEQAAILKSAGYAGGTIVGGQAIPQPKMGKDITGMRDVMIDTGEYQVAVQDAQGNNVGSVTVTKGQPDASGMPTWGLSDVPKTPTAAKANATDYVVKTDKGAYYPDDINNPGGGYHLIVPADVKNADEEIKKAVDRQVAEGQRNARQRNETATGLYATDDELAQIQHLERTDANAANTLKEQIRVNTNKIKNDDAEQANRDKLATQQVLQSQAQTGLIGAQTSGQQATTAATQQTTQAQAAKLPGELQQQAATLAATQASTAATQQQTKIAGAPQIQGGLGANVITRVNPLTGAIDQSQINLAYQPKTQAEIASRVGQIQTLMQQKGAEVQAKVGQNGYTADNALAEFNAWYDQNVAPHQASLQAAQEDSLLARAKDQATMRQGAYQTALGAGTQQVNAFNAMAGANPVGPGYAEAMDVARQGKIPTGEQMKAAFTYQAPNPMDLAKQGTMDALKYIDPTAAAANGMPAPNYQGMDIQGMLNRTNYMPGATMPPPGAPAAPGPPAAPAAPAQPALLPPGAAGVPGVDPRLSGALNPMIPRPPASWTQSMPNFGAPVNPWEIAPNYSPGF